MLKILIPFVIAGLISAPVLAEQYPNRYRIVEVPVTVKEQWPPNNPKQHGGPVTHTVKVPVIIVTPAPRTYRETAPVPKGLHGYGGHWRGRGPGWGPRYYGPGPDIGGAVVGGIIGGAVVNWFNRPPEPPPPPPPPPEPEPAPPPQGASAVVLEPFTGPWYEWCAGKYKSFEAKTGTWTDNDGQKHFCGQ